MTRLPPCTGVPDELLAPMVDPPLLELDEPPHPASASTPTTASAAVQPARDSRGAV